MGFLSSLFKGNKGFAAATNALLAENMLPSLSKADKDNVRLQIAHIFRTGGFPNISDDFIYTQFNSQPRAAQLNLVAMALNELGIEPPFKGESWHEVRNPFLPSAYDASDLAAVQARMSNQHGVHFQLGGDSLHFMDL